jgi:hypothetical protein
MFLGIFDIDEYVPIPVHVHQFSSGGVIQPTTLTYSIYEEGSTTGIDEDVNMTPASPFDSITGAYYARRQLTAAAGFEVNKTYVVIVKATVDGVSAITMFTFQIRNIQSGDAYAVVNSRLPAALESGNIPAIVKAQDNIDFGAAQKASLNAASVTVSDKTGFSLSSAGIQAIWDALTSSLTTVGSIGKLIIDYLTSTLPTLISTLIANPGAGAGTIQHTYTITDSSDGTPIDGVEVWVSTDAAGVNVIASGYTNSSGIINFMLDAGTYYFWRKRSGYNFTNPDLETVEA